MCSAGMLSKSASRSSQPFGTSGAAGASAAPIKSSSSSSSITSARSRSSIPAIANTSCCDMRTGPCDAPGKKRASSFGPAPCDAAKGAGPPTTVTMGGGASGWTVMVRLALGRAEPRRDIDSDGWRLRSLATDALRVSLSLLIDVLTLRRGAKLAVGARSRGTRLLEGGASLNASVVEVAMAHNILNKCVSLPYRSKPKKVDVIAMGWDASENQKSRSMPSCSASWSVPCRSVRAVLIDLP